MIVSRDTISVESTIPPFGSPHLKSPPIERRHPKKPFKLSDTTAPFCNVHTSPHRLAKREVPRSPFSIQQPSPAKHEARTGQPSYLTPAEASLLSLGARQKPPDYLRRPHRQTPDFLEPPHQ